MTGEEMIIMIFFQTNKIVVSYFLILNVGNDIIVRTL